MSAPPALPIFTDAYLADTRHLSLEEHGAYSQLLMFAWQSEWCCLPDDDARIARMLSISQSRWARLKPAVMAFWKLEDGVWRQGRLTKTRSFVDEKRAKSRQAAEYRWRRQVLENSRSDECERMSERISERNASQPQPQSKGIESQAHTSLRASDCFNEVCNAAGWYSETDSQRVHALTLIDGWLARGFDIEQDILAGITKARERRPGERTRSLKRFESTIEGIHRDRTGRRNWHKACQ